MIFILSTVMNIVASGGTEMKVTITQAARSSMEAVTKVRKWYETLEIEFTRSPLVSRAGKGLYNVVVWVDQ